ncbi:MAG TPA: hypothetical protein IGS52_02825 [Oscillatoriaceae cyanobacterium M33_DOE_052]|uniref:Uncharacterized protein n=1 Tax=Planktothricoides sp. SpSt-374 TaxID=2282167 RepID=A0A7C3ZJ04_9CYAN|nr:hypothetical protein [Oscillatoriaceae cyanobacterium M33_DOE_052]
MPIARQHLSSKPDISGRFKCQKIAVWHRKTITDARNFPTSGQLPSNIIPDIATLPKIYQLGIAHPASPVTAVN